MTDHDSVGESPMTPTSTFEVRRADNNVRGLARHIARLVNDHPGILVDLSKPEDHGNRIVVRAELPTQREAANP